MVILGEVLEKITFEKVYTEKCQKKVFCIGKCMVFYITVYYGVLTNIGSQKIIIVY